MVIRLGGSVFLFLSLWNSDSCFRLGRGGGGRETGDKLRPSSNLVVVVVCYGWMDGWIDR